MANPWNLAQRFNANKSIVGPSVVTRDGDKAITEVYSQVTPDDANKTFNLVRDLPEIQAQIQSNADLENELNRLKARPRVQENAWIKPLVALADSETGSNLMAGYTAPEKNKNRDETILRYQDALANRRKQVADSMIGSLGKLRSGSEMKTVLKDVTTDPDKNAALVTKAEANLMKPRSGKQKREFTPFERKQDMDFAADLGTWESGGQSSAAKSIKDLDYVMRQLETGDATKIDLPLIGKTDFGGFAENVPFSKARELRKIIDESVLPTLRATFGAAFTEKEGALKRSLNMDKWGTTEQNLSGVQGLKDFTQQLYDDRERKRAYARGIGEGSLQGFSEMTQPPTPVVSRGGKKAPAGNPQVDQARKLIASPNVSAETKAALKKKFGL